MVAHGGHEATTEAMHGMDMGSSDHGMDMSSSGGHGAMTMAFFTATNTPLYSNSWTPSSAGAYAGSCIFLIVLAITLRAILTLKTYLETKSIEAALKRRYIVVADQQMPVEKFASDSSSVTGILTTNGLQENVRIASAAVQHTQPWRFSTDLPRAALTMVAAGVGYLLMLAVMTYNVGYFLSVLAGVFIGELALGRFSQGAMTM